jgi:hypothetical protein
MRWNARRLIRIFVLFLYVFYAVTPVSMYAMADGDGTRCGILPGKHVSTDIIWANGLFPSLIDEDDMPSTAARISDNALPGNSAVLVKKRRAVFREQFGVKPLFDIKLLLSGGLDRPPARSPEFDITKNPLLRKACGYLVLNADLSPPLLFS